MVEPVIGKLNQVAQKKIGGSPVPLDESSRLKTKSFDQTMSEKLLDHIKQNWETGPENELTVLSAENVNIDTKNTEVAKDMQGNQAFDLFKDLNRDLLSLDSALETLTGPGAKKITPSQLLGLQAGIANTTIFAEGLSKFADAMSRGIQTILNTQIG